MILSEALNEERLERDGQRVETLGPGKGVGLLDQSSTKCGLIKESLEALEDGSQRPGLEVTVDRTDERNEHDIPPM
jgi:hypothetical protein